MIRYLIAEGINVTTSDNLHLPFVLAYQFLPDIFNKAKIFEGLESCSWLRWCWVIRYKPVIGITISTFSKQTYKAKTTEQDWDQAIFSNQSDWWAKRGALNTRFPSLKYYWCHLFLISRAWFLLQRAPSGDLNKSTVAKTLLTFNED